MTPLEIEALSLSLKVALWSVLGVLLPGTALAWLLARRNFPGKAVLDALVHLPLVVPPVVVGYLLLVLLGRRGPLGAALYDLFGVTLVFSWQGAAIAAGVMALPLYVRAVRLSFESVDERLETAARTLGAGRLRVFATVTLPLIVPGLLTGVVLAFARALGEFGATITFVSNIPGQTRTLPLAIYSALQSPDGEAAALRLTILSVILAFAAIAASELIARRYGRALES
ncbi:molybdate ABC transporter permease subunit [Oceanibacterium hippocampi]|uniref:Molybdenum transport system permease n=1 Tax=Oceanibacterium hippocampi TaxID=745714 RepID=A0A1Y5SW55_9PROT|nr:molybdate ABC transporter permease subunit [Oceanibacterium hippocampi]SLN49860.1 Molybdenum transport system permease protein ModB [Oceanibacterium hippocampi]